MLTSEIGQLIKSRGFTLIEVLVVIFIISIISMGIVLSVDTDPRQRDLEDVAEQLLYTIKLSQEKAVLQPAELGLRFEEHEYGVMEYVEGSEDEEGRWQPLTERSLFHRQLIPEKIVVQLQSESARDTEFVEDAPQILFFSSGDMSAFEMTISIQGETPLYQLRGKENGEVRLIDLEQGN